MYTQSSNSLSQKEAEYAQMQQNHPLRFDPGLTIIGSNPSRITMNPRSLNDLEPVIIWVDLRSSAQFGSVGWFLTFQGEINIVLDFAKWDDHEGVERLVASIKDQESLETMAALISPGRANSLALEQNLFAAYQDQKFPSMEIERLRELMKQNKLIVDTYSHREIKTFFVEVNTITIPLAIVVISRKNLRGDTIRLHQDSADFEASLANLTQIRQEWTEKFSKLTTDILQWRSIDAPPDQLYFDDDSTIAWFTSITSAQWSSLDLDKIMPLARLKA